MSIPRLGLWLVSLFVFCISNVYGETPPASSRVQSVALTVDLPQAHQVYRYNKPVRLSRVFADIYPTLSYRPYEIGSSLIRLSKNTLVEQEKRAVIKQLLELNTENAQYIVAQLSNMTFAYRESISLNFDNARLFLKQNPLLSGEFQLVLPKRPDHFLVLGDIHQAMPMTMTLKSGWSLRRYMKEVHTSNQDSQYTPWIIQANQDYQQVKDLYWQGTPYFLSPGAVVFIGLTDLPEKFKHLNQDIVHLLTYRVEK